MWDFEIGVIDDLRWEVVVIETVEHRSAGCARNCAFTEREPVYARLATTMNSNHEQKSSRGHFRETTTSLSASRAPDAISLLVSSSFHTGSEIGVTKNSQLGFEL
ncbi:hypothetical protein Y032_0007g3441 [Ancylostoma ceylanicum]|uniref:Uncharacterized protein n=1 Tax=Ancylostoma ceylanicum TaxID=53326 RepID=A0A016VN08_9BILA|nr:hypothetical protein Y032_0007g3441 [Ancylostoma ceylanicum]